MLFLVPVLLGSLLFLPVLLLLALPVVGVVVVVASTQPAAQRGARRNGR